MEALIQRVLKYLRHLGGINLARNFEDLHVYDAELRALKEVATGRAENQAVAVPATFDPRARLHRAGRNVNARY